MTRTTAFFEGWSWFKFDYLGLALCTNMKFYTSLSKALKLKVRKFWRLIFTFVEVTVEKLVGGRGGKSRCYIDTIDSEFSHLYRSHVEDQFGLFLFSITQRYLFFNKFKNVRCQFTKRILYLTVRPWNSSQNRESHDKTVSLAGLYIYGITGNMFFRTQNFLKATVIYSYKHFTVVYIIFAIFTLYANMKINSHISPLLWGYYSALKLGHIHL